MTKKRLLDGELNEYKADFAHDIPESDLAGALQDADVLLGLSKGGLVSADMIKSMAKNPIIFRWPIQHLKLRQKKLKRLEAMLSWQQVDLIIPIK